MTGPKFRTPGKQGQGLYLFIRDGELVQGSRKEKERAYGNLPPVRLRRGNLEIKAPPGGPRRRLQNGDVIVVGDREMVFANPPMNEPEFEE